MCLLQGPLAADADDPAVVDSEDERKHKLEAQAVRHHDTLDIFAEQVSWTHPSLTWKCDLQQHCRQKSGSTSAEMALLVLRAVIPRHHYLCDAQSMHRLCRDGSKVADVVGVCVPGGR